MWCDYGSAAAGFPTGKQPDPSPGLFETLNRNRRLYARPGSAGSGPSPDFPPGWGHNDSPPPSSPPPPRFLVCISLPGHVAAGAATHRPYPVTWA